MACGYHPSWIGNPPTNARAGPKACGGSGEQPQEAAWLRIGGQQENVMARQAPILGGDPE